MMVVRLLRCFDLVGVGNGSWDGMADTVSRLAVGGGSFVVEAINQLFN